ncbi:MAG: hypothetical protein CVV64_04395 [Candidatus Wallbacteria bacterium HGW-Wallbacteria-1]|uniref:Uncharacterized protein n=1 Tax=Candidatus Wallbacteria bacterium HGW-Wallbacteria-1 TaxID=2013854 RepID=A0A2N1PRQ6_9BACT|nr:MAG: hypothetical protein CVV64_04395 [Candidatus Wallbacteria bacterium HGW-Wallbacteria-1]
MFAGFPFIALPLIGDIIGKIGDGAENIFILLLFFLVFRSLLAAVAETYKTGYFVAITAFSVCFFGFIFLFSGAVQLL